MATIKVNGKGGPLQTAATHAYNENIDRLRDEEYPMLKDTVYLDHAGTTPYPKALIEQSSQDLLHNLLGNPHSNSPSSQLSTRRIEDVRLRALRFFKANPDFFDLIFVANATAGIKLLTEGFRECQGGFWYGYHRDAHTSLIGVRESAAEHHCFTGDEEVAEWLQSGAPSHGDRIGLFAYPAQSNLNGRRLPLSWPGRLRRPRPSSHGSIYSLLDAAAFVSTSPLDLSDASQAPDFTVLSFYKIFGYPDLGALIVRKDSDLQLRRRKYFGGGTVEMVTCMEESWHIKKQNTLHEQLEDGTLPFHSIIALDTAFDVYARLFGPFDCISSHTSFLADRLYKRLSSLCHANGLSVCSFSKDSKSSYEDSSTQGPIVALNICNSKAEWVSNAEVEKLATIKNIQFRTGGLCNPGGVASFLELTPREMKRNFSAGHRCGNENDIQEGKPTGVIRLSLGAASNIQDVAAFIQFVEEFFVDRQCQPQPGLGVSRVEADFHVETLSIYPIKSCGGWKVPASLVWNVKPEGLAWDREWCLVHQGTRAALSQKKIPRMALLRPSIDLEGGVLRVRYGGRLPSSISGEITVPLSNDAGLLQNANAPYRDTYCPSLVCGDPVSAYTYTSPDIAAFFSAALSTPCTLARFAPGPLSTRHSKIHLQGPKVQYPTAALPPSQPVPGAFPPTPPASPPTPYIESHPTTPPLLLSNESPILTVSRSSLNHLNKTITSNSLRAKPAPASVFRANIILAQSGPGKPLPYDEDYWISLRILSPPPCQPSSTPSSGRCNSIQNQSTDLDVLAPCGRCQMICINQETAERTEEPFVTLAKTRRMQGEGKGQKVFFGVHCALGPGEGGVRGRRGTVRVGDRVVVVRRVVGRDDGMIE
ncbi:MAG: hypothetical protein Q9166_004366 [cf. Caloplaca sp. 2 TL-2023]